VLDRVRAHCLALPDVVERPSHGSPAWFVGGKRCFVMYLNDHHGDGREALWLAAADGMQAAFVESSAEHYFVPPYVGHRGWLGVRLDRGLPWDDVAGAIEDAHELVSAR
jgi:YjbR protein